MAFLYAGLGIAMISGIAAMMEVANNVSNFNVISGIKLDKYIEADLAKHDRRFLEIINNPTAINGFRAPHLDLHLSDKYPVMACA